MIKPFLTQFRIKKVDNNPKIPFTFVYNDKLSFNNIVPGDVNGASLLMATKTSTQCQSETLDNDFDNIDKSNYDSDEYNRYHEILLATKTSTKTLLEGPDED